MEMDPLKNPKKDGLWDVPPVPASGNPPSASDKYFLVDYVLAYNIDHDESHPMRKPYRDLFIDAMKEEHLLISYETVGRIAFIKLTCPFDRLALEAERTKLEMPLKGLDIHPAQPTCCGKLQKLMTTDDDVDFVSAPFECSKFHLFEGCEEEETFFRSSLRGFLVHNILINIDIKDKLISCNIEYDVVQRRGLMFLLMKKALEDAFVMHDQSAEDPYFMRIQEASLEQYYKSIPNLKLDPRKEMNHTWTKFWKFQPLWKIRNYFGEKIAFYFAWIGTFLTLLWIPAILGLSIFIYGVYESVHVNTFTCSDQAFLNTTKGGDECSGASKYKRFGEDMLGMIRESFDNVFTPFFSLVICLWSTLFLEIWKRNRYTLAYQWDVNTYSMAEPDRPEFFGTCQRADPITGELAWIYPLSRRLRKFAVSFIVSGSMIILVFLSVAGVVAFKVEFRARFNCSSDGGPTELVYNEDEAGSPGVCLFFVTILPTIANVASILILGFIYQFIAVKLTGWENHRTQSEYNDALIIKLFAFQFANTYTSLFYMAFFRPDDHGFQDNGAFNWGPQYKDTCQKGQCMSLLSFQVLVLMIMKPFPKFFKDIVWPWLKSCLRRAKRIPQSETNKVGDVTEELSKDGNNKDGDDDINSETSNSFIEREFLKPIGGDFTMGEYTEKVIMFGYIVMFAASFPVAPFLALIICLVDVRVDAKRLLYWNRRPVAFIASDIGMWYSILQFVNFCGAVSNAFLIGFTSSFCDHLFHPQQCTADKRLVIVLVFEHIVFMSMYIINIIIPDIPASIKLAQRRERYQIQKILEEGKVPLRLGARDGIRNTEYINLPKIDGINNGFGNIGKDGIDVKPTLGQLARRGGSTSSDKQRLIRRNKHDIVPVNEPDRTY